MDKQKKTVRKNYRLTPKAAKMLADYAAALNVSENAVVEMLVLGGASGLKKAFETRLSAISRLSGSK